MRFLPSVTSFFCSISDQLWGSGRTCQRPEVRWGLHHRPERDVFLSARLPDGERELCYPHLHPQRHLERNITHLPRYRVWGPFFFSNYHTETFWWFAEALSATNKQMLLCSCQGFLDCKRAIVSEGKHQRILFLTCQTRVRERGDSWIFDRASLWAPSTSRVLRLLRPSKLVITRTEHMASELR